MYGGLSGMGNSYGAGQSYSNFSRLGRSYGAPAGMSQPGLPNNQDQDPQRNPRKAIFEEWFKMMGGLRSVIELGFAAIAIANFYTHLSAMASKLAGMVKSMMSSIINFINKRLTGKMLSKLTNPETRLKTLKGLLLNITRVFSTLLLCLAFKLKFEIRRDSDERLKKL